MARRTSLAGLLLALVWCTHAGANELRWTLQVDAPQGQVDAALQRLGSELLQSSTLTDAQRSHALLASGRFAQAQASIQQVRAGLITAGDPAAAQRWTSMLLMATAAGTDDPAYAGAFHALFSGLDDAEDAACRRPWLRWDQRGRTRQGLGHRHHRSLRT